MSLPMLRGKRVPPGPRSWSQLDAYDTCHLRFGLQYVAKLPFTKPLALRFGAAFHDFRYRYYDHCRSEGFDSDWDVVPKLAMQTFHDHELPMDKWDEFLELCNLFVENRPYNPQMGIEVRFGVRGDGTFCKYDEADYFRGIIDGIEVTENVGTITDTKTSKSMDVPFTQIEIYAAFLSLRYPEVKEWRLVYDFPRFGRIKDKQVLSENLANVREHVAKRIGRLEGEKDYKPQPGPHCLECPFFSICDYRMQGVTAPRNPGDVASMIEDYFMAKARIAQIRRLIKSYVETFGDVETDNAKAAFFLRETKSCDKINLIRMLKKAGRNPVEYVDFPASVLHALRKDRLLADEAANLIFIDTVPTFDIRKKRKGEQESPNGHPDGNGDSNGE